MSTDTPKRGRGRPKLIPQDVLLKPAPRLLLSARAERDIHFLARATKIEINQVLEDVITNGLIQTRGMYSEVIESRKMLEAKRNAYRRTAEAAIAEDRRPPQEDHSGTNGSEGTITNEFDPGLRPESSDAFIGPGHTETQHTHSEDSGEFANLVEGPELPTF